MLEFGVGLPDLLSIISGTLITFGFARYIVYLSGNKITPNPFSWFMWSILGLIAVPDNIKWIILHKPMALRSVFTLLDVFLCIVILEIALIKTIEHVDVRKIGITGVISTTVFIISLAWLKILQINENNPIYQIPLVISFFPTITGTMSGQGKEKPLPWLYWSGAFYFDFLAINTIGYTGFSYWGCIMAMALQLLVFVCSFPMTKKARATK